jgi:hypothetical protein
MLAEFVLTTALDGTMTADARVREDPADDDDDDDDDNDQEDEDEEQDDGNSDGYSE